jgi:hypothetical protein
MKSTAECYKALLGGEKLKNKSFRDKSFYVYLNDGILMNNRGEEDLFYFNVPELWEIYEEPKWYENIPEGGVLCWVSDTKKDDEECIAAICHHNEKVNNSYTELDVEVGWKYATPLTKEEIQVFLNNVPEDV